MSLITNDSVTAELIQKVQLKGNLLQNLRASESKKQDIRLSILYGYIPINCIVQILLFSCWAITAYWNKLVSLTLLSIVSVVCYWLDCRRTKSKSLAQKLITQSSEINPSTKINEIESLLRNLSDLGYDAGDRYAKILREKNNNEKTSSYRPCHVRCFFAQIFIITTFYTLAHVMCALNEYKVEKEYLDQEQNEFILMIHFSSCLCLVLDSYRLLRSLQFVEGLARELHDFAAEDFYDVETY